ncbi:YcxB family protein [Paenibacillus agri]|uniref:YcxB family protein n=1 Tax=Paenibacillus agri TaxID=2744309 RepID=A0A850EVQ7_9BACL|nr:YcxB family protein [Paenibacillus agri]NUU62932.1 YcxB family protein [Paenibacillus agri]
MSQEIKVDTELSSGDVQEFNLWFSLNSRIIVTSFSVVAYFAIMLAITKNYSTSSLSILAVTAVGLAIILWFITRSSLTKKSKRAFESDNQSKLPQSYVISDEGIRHQSDSGSGHVKWEEIYKIGETASLFAFFVSANQALILPKRFFQSEDDKQFFKELARKHMFSNRVKFKG